MSVTDTAWIDAALTSARPQAVGALLRYFRNLDTAEEAFQNACLRALKSWPQNGPPRDPASWLIMVGRNVAIDDIRRSKKQEALPDDDRAISDLDDAEDEHLAHLDAAELQRLPNDRRESVAQHLKGLGNKAYSSKKYEEAIAHYTKAIAAWPSAVFFSNRAACYSNLGKLEEVIKDCDEALKMDNTYVKALNRRAVAADLPAIVALLADDLARILADD